MSLTPPKDPREDPNEPDKPMVLDDAMKARLKGIEVRAREKLRTRREPQRLNGDGPGVFIDLGLPMRDVAADGSPGVFVVAEPRVLFCPACKIQHVDEGEWATKLHHTHLCAGCGHKWRVAPYAVGVAVGVAAAPVEGVAPSPEPDCACPRDAEDPPCPIHGPFGPFTMPDSK